jgi:hypothetical protein
MPTLGTQNISTSYPQLLKTFGTGGLDGTLQVVTDGDNTSSALSVSTSGVASTGTFEVVGTSLLTGEVTFGTSFTASTGTATIGAAVIGATTFTTGFTSSTGTNTLGTASIAEATISTATISTATIGATIFTTGFTSSTGTNTLGTSVIGETTFTTGFTSSTGTNTLGISVIDQTTFTTGFTSSTGTNTLGTIESTTFTNTGIATFGTLQVGASGPKLTAVTYGTAAFTLSTVAAHNGAGTTNGTVALTGTVLGDMVIGSLDSLGSATGSTGLIIGFHTIGSDVVRFSITNPTSTIGTVPAGTLQMTALRFTA